MTDLVFAAPTWPTVPVVGGGAFPVRRVFCVGRNYAAHAKEMGFEVDREAPFYFTKSPLAILPTGRTVPYALGTKNFHYEMEFIVAIGAPAFRAAKETAMDAVFGYACGLDMTRRDLQIALRDKGRPWDLAKDVENSAVIAPITRKEAFGAVAGQRITLAVDGAVRQDARLSELVWSIPELIADLSKFYHLAPGDLIYTGTPAGVGAVQARARMRGEVEGLTPVELTLSDAE